MHPLKSLPNWLTIFRILLIPVLIIIFYLPFEWSHGMAAIIFFIAGFTDWLDGYLARKLKQMSPFGAFLDPVADKLLVTTSLILLLGVKDLNYITLPAIVIVGREITISALREWMAEIGRRTSVTVNNIGKIKTAIQMLALFLLLGFYPGQSIYGTLGVIMLYLAALLTMWSMVVYLTIAWPEFFIKKDDISC